MGHLETAAQDMTATQQDQRRQAEAIGLGTLFALGMLLLRYGPLIRALIKELRATVENYGPSGKQFVNELTEILKEKP